MVVEVCERDVSFDFFRDVQQRTDVECCLSDVTVVDDSIGTVIGDRDSHRTEVASILEGDVVGERV